MLPDLLFLLALSSEQDTQSWEQTATAQPTAHGWAECGVASQPLPLSNLLWGLLCTLQSQSFLPAVCSWGAPSPQVGLPWTLNLGSSGLSN